LLPATAVGPWFAGMAKRRIVSTEDFVKIRLQVFSFIVALVVGFAAISSCSLLRAQSQDQQPAQHQSQAPTADQPQSQPDQTPSQPPTDPQSQSQAQPPAQQSSDSQSFTGTIVKSGSKWMFQDAATGTTYDIDHQDEVKKFEGKRVKVRGTLDPDKKMIHVQ